MHMNNGFPKNNCLCTTLKVMNMLSVVLLPLRKPPLDSSSSAKASLAKTMRLLTAVLNIVAKTEGTLIPR